jgi:hypothetical protein
MPAMQPISLHIIIIHTNGYGECVHAELHECSPSAIADASLDNGNARSPPISLHHTIAHTHSKIAHMQMLQRVCARLGNYFCYVLRILHSLTVHAISQWNSFATKRFKVKLLSGMVFLFENVKIKIQNKFFS